MQLQDFVKHYNLDISRLNELTVQALTTLASILTEDDLKKLQVEHDDCTDVSFVGYYHIHLPYLSIYVIHDYHTDEDLMSRWKNDFAYANGESPLRFVPDDIKVIYTCDWVIPGDYTRFTKLERLSLLGKDSNFKKGEQFILPENLESLSTDEYIDDIDISRCKPHYCTHFLHFRKRFAQKSN